MLSVIISQFYYLVNVNQQRAGDKVFALCLESKKEVGEQTQWGLIVEVHPRGAHKKGQLLATPHRVVKMPYDITYADGINNANTQYMIKC